jgi:hypothetical protein
MAGNSSVLFSQQYASAVELTAQQMRPRVASLFNQMTAVGMSATVANFVDAFEAEERTALYDDIVFGEPNHTRPWVYPVHFDKALPFDSIEQMQMNANPTSEYVQGIVAALNRKADKEAIRALFASRNLGQSGGTVDSFASGNQVSVDEGGTASGLNVQKIQKALQLARTNEVGIDEPEMFHIVISPIQEKNIMDEIEVISSDFTVKRILDAGTIAGSNYMGLNWVISNALLTDGSSYRRVPFFTTRGMSFCTWNGGIQTNVSQRTDKRGQPWQVYGQGHFGAVRRDAKRVYEIKCAES